MEPTGPMASRDPAAPGAQAPLPDRVNAEPAIIRGLSSTESLWAIGLAFLLWLPVAGVVGLAVRNVPIAVLIIVAGPLATVWLASGQMAKLKRNRPDHYYIHLALHWAASMHLVRARFITHTGAWDIGRTLPPARVVTGRHRPPRPS